MRYEQTEADREAVRAANREARRDYNRIVRREENGGTDCARLASVLASAARYQEVIQTMEEEREGITTAMNALEERYDEETASNATLLAGYRRELSKLHRELEEANNRAEAWKAEADHWKSVAAETKDAGYELAAAAEADGYDRGYVAGRASGG